MSDTVQIGAGAKGKQLRRPPWMRVKIKNSQTFKDVSTLLDGLHLNTVCKEARCPNIWECWGQHRTATFMIMGDICTRACRYCSVTSGKPNGLDLQEPQNVARAVQHLKLSHAVVTSVDRDDLIDFGASHFANTIAAIRRRMSGCRIEVLIPDFGGDADALDRVLDAEPDVLNHNTETVPRLFPRLRAKGDFERSMQLLARADAYRRQQEAPMVTKSGIIVGLGETIDELLEAMDALRAVNCDVLTIGQYLNPTRKHAPIDRFYTPDEFDMLRHEGLERGFKHVESGPLVRSSYHAHEHVPGR